MKIKLQLLMFCLYLTSLLCHSQQRQDFTPNFTVSKQTTHKISEDQDFTFGYMEVLENRNDPESKTIKFPVYIFKSRNPNPQPDPIIYTVGGPGRSTMSSAQYMKYYRYLDDRDVILVEQRGTYYAEPHLACPEWDEALSKSSLKEYRNLNSKPLFADAARKCRQRFSNKNIDLNGYNTKEIAADINELTEVLNIDQYNLLTISYSTKIAQVLLRDYPNRIRSVVMDSPLPLEVSYDEESVTNLLAVATKILEDCERDENCNFKFPNLKSRFFKLLRDYTKTPLEVIVKNPTNGSDEVFYLKGSDLINIISLSSTESVPFIPSEIDKILNGDLGTIKNYLQSLFNEAGDGAGQGMRLSVWCSEEYPFTSEEVIQTETNRYPEVKGLSPVVFDAEICEIWGVAPAKAIENKAITSEIPVLFISGEYDENTPVKWAANMLPNFKNGVHVIFKGWKHTPTTYWSNPCGMEVANTFFNNPNEQPEPKCFKQIKTPKFKTQ